MKEIKRFTIVKTARIIALLYFVIAVLVSIPTAIITIVSGGQLGVSVFLMPFAVTIMAYIMITIVCAVYNFLAGKIGGIEIEIE